MTTVLLVLRGVLAVVLLVAAVAKVRDQNGTRQAATALGVPARFATLVALALPVVETAAVVLLVVPDTARVGAGMALVLLGAFTVAIARTLRSGARPSCHCFGQMSDEPIGTTTLVRNAALLALAAVILAGGSRADASIVDAVAADGAAALLNVLGGLLVVAAVVAATLLGDQRGQRRKLDDLELTIPPVEGIAVGREAPVFELPDLDGRRWHLSELIAEKPALLVFTDAACAPCQVLLPELADWSEIYEEAFRIVVVASGGREANLAKRDEHGLHVLLQDRYEVAEAYRYAGTPGAVLVGTDFRIAEPLAAGLESVRSLIARAGAARGGIKLPIGVRAPRFHVHDTDGRHVDNESISGSMTVLLFWDEGCSFCRSIDTDISDGLDRFAEVGVQVVVASPSGGTGWAPTDGVSVLPDTERAVANAMGSPGTPSALLIDADGKVASAMAVGGPEVLALLDRAAKLGRMAGSIAVRGE